MAKNRLLPQIWLQEDENDNIRRNTALSLATCSQVKCSSISGTKLRKKSISAIQQSSWFGIDHQTTKPGIFDHPTIKIVHIWSLGSWCVILLIWMTRSSGNQHLCLLM